MLHAGSCPLNWKLFVSIDVLLLPGCYSDFIVPREMLITVKPTVKKSFKCLSAEQSNNNWHTCRLLSFAAIIYLLMSNTETGPAQRLIKNVLSVRRRRAAQEDVPRAPCYRRAIERCWRRKNKQTQLLLSVACCKPHL